MENKVKIGVFGGGRGATMIHQLLNHPDAELVAVCDKFEPLLEKAKAEAKKVGIDISVYTDFDEFIRHDMDAVVLANYANEHAVYAIKCLKAGKHVMSEVLPGETPAQLVELIETVEQTGLVYTYAENYCYMKAPFEMWRRYRAGDIGEFQYGEGEYIHDCTSIWPDITYGERNHWRNLMFPTFYCTHSCGPLISITGLRPVQVVGFEPNINKEEKQMRIGYPCSCGIEMITLENGGIVKSVHGTLKREPGSINYQVYGTKGMMESKRYNDEEFNLYQEGPKVCVGDWAKYDPTNPVGADIKVHSEGHGGSDFYTTHCFVEKILGKPDGEWTIDVYTAASMGLCGIMAWRSVLAGNKPMEVPDFRVKTVRDRYRFDNACCTPSIAGDKLLPNTSHEVIDIPDSAFEAVRLQWLRDEASPIRDLFDIGDDSYNPHAPEKK